MNLNSIESDMIKKFNYRDLVIFLLPLLIFSLYLFIYNPGVLTVGSFAQLHQIATGKFTNAFPIFHTLIEMLCLKIYSSPVLIGIIQILVFCLIWMIICKYHRDDSTSDDFFLQFIVTLIVSLIPVNAVYSITLSPNILFSYALLFLCFLIKVMVDRNGQLSNMLMIIIGLTLACVSGFSTYGVYIALISLIIIITYLFMNKVSKKTIIKLSVLAIACVLLITSLNIVYNVGSDSSGIQTNDAFGEEINLEAARSQFFSTTPDSPTADFENSSSQNMRNSRYGLFDGFVNLIRENIILNTLFSDSILYLIFSVVLLAFIYVITKNREMILVFTPILLNVILVFLTGKFNLYSNLLIFYMLAIVLISIWHGQGLKPQNIATPTITPPEETYEYSTIESQIDDLTLDDINELLGESLGEDTIEMDEIEPEIEPETKEVAPESDLIDEILKEIEMEKKE